MYDSTFYIQYIEHYALRNEKYNLSAPPLSKVNSSSFLLLYTSHFLQTFGDRLWQFAVPLLFTELFTNTLFPQALFLFFTNLAVSLFIPLFGAWIDSTNRLYVVTTTIWLQNISIIISCIIMFILGYYYDIIIKHHASIETIDYKLILCFVGLLSTSMIGQIMGTGATLSLEQDWVVVLCTNSDTGGKGQNTNKKLLSTVNARMRRIDLVCKIIAPAFFGIYTEFIGDSKIQKVFYGSAVILLWNVIGCVLEWMTIKLLYQYNHTILSMTNKRGKKAKKNSAFILLYRGWRAYSKSPVLFASVAMCMLYVNVLSGGIGAIFGILGTLITPWLHNTMELSHAVIGLISIWMFWFALVPVGVSQVVIGPNAFALPYIILCCMIVARTGIWSFDLSIAQLLQTMVKESDAANYGQVNGTHVALCQMFYTVSSILTMCLHHVDQFDIVMWVTIITIFAACVVYSLWYLFPFRRYDNTNHLRIESKTNDDIIHIPVV
eukprot:638603_1